MNLKLFLRPALATAMLCAVLATSAAGINKGFFKKASQRVWAMQSENLFNARKFIPDSLSSGASAVVIARHDDFVGKRIEQNSIYSETGRTNRTALEHASRSMVKLLDESAVEEFSSFEFGGMHEKHEYGIEPIRRTDKAFGVRVHKPDGKIVEVDVNEALEVSDGKNGGKTKRFKLAVPGLEVGDVVEYFYYNEYENDYGDIELVDVMIADRYPVMSRLMTGKFDPTLTIELKAYNGAPLVERTGGGNSDNVIRMFCSDIPAVGFRKFLLEERQLPFIRLNTINNHDQAGTYVSRAKSSRRAGVYQNVSADRIQYEAMENTAQMAHWMWKLTKPISQIPTNATKLVRNYAKAHPGATPRELADVAWLAVRYLNFTAKDDDYYPGSFFVSMFHNEVIEKLDCYPRDVTGIAFANGRDEVPVDELAKWNQSTFMSVVGDTVYNMTTGYYYAPGEQPAMMQGERAARITGRLRDLTYGDSPEYVTLPDRKFGGNKLTAQSTVTVNPENEHGVLVKRKVELTGSKKAKASGFTDQMEYIGALEEYLGIDAGKRYKSKTYDVAERKRDFNTALKDECREVMGVTPDSVTSFNMESRGILPGDIAMKYSMECSVPDIVEDLGDAISVSLGKLLGQPTKLEGSERERLLDAMLFTAGTEMHLLTFVVPDGYAVDETSLADFNRQVANPVGQFVVQAKINDDGNIEVQGVNRLRYHSVALQAWPMLRDLCDAGAEFNEASIVLSKK